MAKTRHVINWKADRPRTVCGLSTDDRIVLPALPVDITCSVCALRVLREGQRRGLKTAEAAQWTWEDLGTSYQELVVRS